jgi:hypothetical protein
VILSWACSHVPQVGLLDGPGDFGRSYIPTWSTGTIRRTPHTGMLDCWVGSKKISSIFYFFLFRLLCFFFDFLVSEHFFWKKYFF